MTENSDEGVNSKLILPQEVKNGIYAIIAVLLLVYSVGAFHHKTWSWLYYQMPEEFEFISKNLASNEKVVFDLSGVRYHRFDIRYDVIVENDFKNLKETVTFYPGSRDTEYCKEDFINSVSEIVIIGNKVTVSASRKVRKLVLKEDLIKCTEFNGDIAIKMHAKAINIVNSYKN